MRRFLIVLLSSAAVVGTAVAGFSFAGVTAPKTEGVTTEVTVHMGEYYFQLSTDTVPAGTIIFTLINDGNAPHDFSIAGTTSDVVLPKATATMTVTITDAGIYPYLCTLPGHATAGMNGNLTVTGTPLPTTPSATVKVSLSEFKIVLKNRSGTVIHSVKHGLIRFKVTNRGKIGHNFVVNKHQTPVLKPGKSATLDVLLKTGKYKYLCSVTGHAAAGMKGVLRVT